MLYYIYPHSHLFWEKNNTHVRKSSRRRNQTDSESDGNFSELSVPILFPPRNKMQSVEFVHKDLPHFQSLWNSRTVKWPHEVLFVYPKLSMLCAYIH